MSTPMSAKEAAEALGVSLTTLYAYVSRGQIRSEAVDGSRERRYRREDVESLLARKEDRKEPGRVAERALHWGTPVLDSAISLISEGGLYYRGQDACRLAETETLEAVAALIWGQPVSERAATPASPRVAAVRKALAQGATLGPVARCQILLPLVGAEDLAAMDRRPAAVAQAGTRILRFMAATIAETQPGTRPLAECLQLAWLPDTPRAVRWFDAALILAADHELNVSAFTARCVASAGAGPYDVVSAGLAALTGALHGGHCARVEALFDEAARPERAEAVLAARLRRGETVPGFGQPLYPQGDPRGGALLALARAVRPGHAAVVLADALATAADRLLDERPTIDFGLVTLARALELPEGSAIALFALGRTVGWIGHAIEQIEANRMIRPRARYTGVLPG